MIAESDAARRAWLRGRFPGVTLVEDGAELLRDAAIRAVVIALPTGAAAAVAEAAFLAGKHVYVEKPGARSAIEWEPVVAAWSRSGTTGVVGYNFRRNPIFLDAVQRVREGAVGRVLAMQARFTWAPDRVEGWRARLATGGGVLLDLASHHIDLTSQLLDDRVDRVRCVTHSHRAEEDTAAVSLDFHGGACGQLFVSSAAGAHENRITVVGSAGVLDVDLLDPRPAPVRRRPGRMERARRFWNALQGLHPARVLRSTRHEPSFATALGIFLDGALAGTRLRPDPRDGLRVHRVIDAARTSAATGGTRVDVSADNVNRAGPGNA
jgi:predicted dehydrogenase